MTFEYLKLENVSDEVIERTIRRLLGEDMAEPKDPRKLKIESGEALDEVKKAQAKIPTPEEAAQQPSAPNNILPTVSAKSVDMPTRDEVIDQLIHLGGMIPTVPRSEITEQWIIAAQYKAIEQITNAGKNTIEELRKADIKVQSFYREALRNNLTVHTKDSEGRVTLTPSYLEKKG